MGFVVDAVQQGNGSSVTRWALVLAGLAVIGALLWWPRAWVVTHAAVDTEADIRSRLFERILRVDLRTLNSLDIGQVVSRTTADLRLVRTLLTGGTPVIAQVIVGYVFLMVTAGYHHPLLGLASLVPVIAVLTISILRVKRDTDAPTRSRDLLGDATTVIDESLRSIDVIRADNQRNAVYEQVASLVEQARESMTSVFRRNARMTAVMTAVPYFSFAIVVGLAGYLVTRDPGFSVGEMVTVSLLMIHVAAPTISLGTLVGESQEASAAARRVNAMLAWVDAPQDVRLPGENLRVRDLRIGSPERTVLDNVSVEVDRGQGLGIRGGPGSGKTALLRVLHGMEVPDAGSIRTPPTTLVTSEDAIFDGTVREAVTYGFSDISQEQLDTAAQQAGLSEVVDSLPQGWDTPLGSQGSVVLSGGQAQRVRLARGLLADRELLLMDAPTVGLDAGTAAEVNRGIRQERASRSLLVTADSPGGLGPTTRRAEIEDRAIVSLPEVPSIDADRASPLAPAASSSAGVPAPPAAAAPRGAAQATPAKNAATKKAHREAKRRRRALIGHLLRPDRGWVIATFAAVALTAVSSLVPIYVGMDLANQLASDSRSGSLWPLVIGLFVVAVITGMALFCAEFLIPWIGQRVLARLRLQSFRALLNVHLAYFDRQRVGAIVSKLTNNIELLETAIRGGARVVVSSLVTLIIVAGLLVILDLELALVAYTILPVIVIFAIVLQRAQRWAMHRNIAGISDLTVSIRDAVRGAATIRAFGTQNHHRAQFDQYNEFERTALLRSSYVFKAFAAATQFVVAIDVALIVAIGGRDAVAGALAVTTMVLFASYLQNGVSPVSTIATIQAVYGQTSVALDQLVALTSLHPDPQLTQSQRAEESSQIAAAVEYRDVWFAYTKEGGWVLKDANLTVRRGEHLVIVGKTGGGKSSLIKLALRFYSPIKGSVSVNGVPVAEADETWLREQIAYVPQEPVVFTGTLRGNLTASRPDADEAAITEVVTALGIQGSVIGDLGGLDAQIGAKGAQPSAGQRQLIAIARALIANRAILIVDEATSHLDPEQEARVIAALRCNRPDRTVIAVAHHLDWAQQGDQIVVIAHRGIAEQGTHEELLAAGKDYARLWDAHCSRV